MKNKGPKILLIDIETLPMQAYVWGLWDQNVPLNMIKKDWTVLSFAAKWIGSDKIIYHSVQNKKDINDDKSLVKKVWDLLDEADIVVGQNSKDFDIKKLNARFIINDMHPPSTFKQIDTLKLARKYFAFTSNKLEYLSNNLAKKHKKLTKRQFDGFELWKECMAGNPKAWKELKDYNIIDVLALEEVYNRLLPWDASLNFEIYKDVQDTSCNCGSKDWVKRGYYYTSSGKYQLLRCSNCGTQKRDMFNLLSKKFRDKMKRGVTR